MLCVCVHYYAVVVSVCVVVHLLCSVVADLMYRGADWGRLLTNENVRLMWFTYCGASSDRVALETFVMAVSMYLAEQLGMPAEAVDDVLTAECREALALALDVDGNGEVRGPP